MAQFAIDEILTTGIQISGFIFDYSSRLGTPGQVLTATSSGVMWQADSSNADLSSLSGQIAATGTLLNNRINSLSGYANDTFLSGSGTQYYVPRWNTSKELVTGSIYDNGFVGIGITNPSGQLHLRNMGFTSQSGISDSNIFPNATGVFGLVMDHDVYTNGQYRHRLVKIDRGGNIPLYLQQAGGAANQYINLARFGTHTYSTNTFEVFGDSRINGTASITSNLLVTGNVGIGTANPAVKLHIENSGTISSIATVRLVGSTGNNAGSQIEFYKAQTPEAAIGLASAVTGGLSDDLLLLSTNPNSIVLTAGLSGLATFKPDGKVGIGIYNPISLLSIGGAASTSAASGLSFGQDAQANLYRSAEDTIKTDGSLVVTSNGTFAGNVGIGTTGPLTALDVRGRARVQNNTAGTAFYVQQDDGSNDVVEFYRNTTSNFILKSNGNVGIGITNPAFKLDVSGGNARFSDYIIVGEDLAYPSNTGSAYLGYTTSPASAPQSNLELIDALSNAIGVNDPLRFRTTISGQYFSGNNWYADPAPLPYRNLLNGNANSYLDLVTSSEYSVGISGKRFVVDQGTTYTRPNFILLNTDWNQNFWGFKLNVENSNDLVNWTNCITEQNFSTNNARGTIALSVASSIQSGGISRYFRFSFVANQAITAGSLRVNKIRSLGNQNYSSYIPVSTSSTGHLIASVGIISPTITSLSGNLATTGSTLDSKINSLSGYSNSNFISGQGVANWTARWNGTKELITGSIYDIGTAVGIGTTSPAAKLQISKIGDNGSNGLVDYGIVTVSSGYATQATLGAETIGDGYSNLNLGSNIGGVRTFWHISKRLSSSTSPHALQYFYYNGSTFNELFTFATGGSLGIGSNNPAAKLDIRQSSATTALKVFTNDTTTAYIAQFIGYDNVLGDTTRMVIQAGGNVGIGTLSPSQKLQIVGSGTPASPIVLQVAGLNDAGGDAKIIVSQNPGASDLQLLVAGTDVRSDGLIPNDQYIFAGQRLNIFNRGNGSTYNTQISLGESPLYGGISFSTAMQNASAVNRMYISPSGNIGINTTSPTSKLHVIETTATGTRIQLGTSSESALMNSGSTNDLLILNAPYGVNSATTSNIGAKWGIKFVGTVDSSLNVNNKTCAIYAVSEDSLGYNRGTSLAFYTNQFNDIPYAEKMRISHNGNIGIGVTNPSNKVQISGGGISFTTSTGLAVPMIGILPTNIAYVGPYNSPEDGNSPALVLFNHAASVQQIYFYSSGRIAMVLNKEGRLNIAGNAGNTPPALLNVGPSSSVAATSGMSFGNDSSANLYRSAASTIKTDGSLEAAVGIISPTITSLSGNIAATGSTLDAKINTLSGYSNATFATITNLAATGSTLDTKINSLSGYSNANFATILNLAATGSVLDTKINSLSGYAGNTFLSGVGVSNYVPRWSGTKLLVTGSIYDLGTGVGIGTTSPGAKLDVVGAVRMPVIRQSTTLYAGTDIIDDNSTRTVYFNIPEGGNNPARYFKVARIKITSNYQNVSLNGYFTTTNSALHVGYERKVEFDFIAYAATNPGAPQVTYLKRGPDTTNVLVYAVPDGGGAGTTYYDVYIKNGWYNDTNGELAIRVGYSSAVTVWQAGLDSGTSAPVDTLVNPNSNYAFDTAGNIGIGSTNPAYKLDVNGSAGFTNGITVNADASSTSYFVGANGTRPIIFQNNTASAYDFGFKFTDLNTFTLVGGNTLANPTTDLVSFTYDGKVGIGITNPLRKLHISSSDNQLIFISGSTAGTWMDFQSSTSNLWSAGADGTNGFAIFNRTTNANAVTVANGGNVGIGTTNPTVKLHIINSGTVSSIATVRLVGSTGNNAGSQIEFYKAQTPEASIGLASAVTGGLSDDLILLSANPNSIVLSAGASGISVFKADGKVGIGTINPQTLLSLGGLGSTSAASGLTFGGDAQANLYRSAEDTIRTDGSLVVNGNFNTNTTTVTTLNINAGTLPGIPAGSTITGFTYAVNNGNVSQINLVETRFATGSDWTTASTRIQKRTDVTNQAYIEFNPSGASYGMALGVGANSNVEALRILSNGYVGIATTNPAGKLQVVQGDANARYSTFSSVLGLLVKGNDNSAYNLLTLENTQTGTNYGASINFNLGYGGNSAAAGTAILGARIVAAAEQNFTSTASTQDGYLALYTTLDGASSEKVRVRSDGNVGIGATNPSQKLEVSGNIKLTDGGYIYGDTTAPYLRLNQANGTYLAYSTTSVLALLGSVTTLSAGSNYLGLITNGSERFRISSNGNVGIGVTNPIEKLMIAGNIQLSGSNTSLNFNTDNAGNGNISFDGSTFTFVSNSNSAPIIFSTTSTERARITNAGRLGIGTSSPVSLLSVGGPGSTTAASGLTFGAEAASNIYRSSTNQLKTDGSFVVSNTLIVGGGENGVRILKDGSDSISSTLYLANAGNTRAYNFQQNAAGTNLALWGFNSSNAWQNLVNFNYNGNVGIGTTAASGRLHIVSTTVGDTVLRTDGTNGTLFSVVDDLSDSLMSVNNSAGLPVLEVFADDRIVAGQYGSGDFVLVNNKVGIGTSNPSYKLDVNGSLGINASTSDTNWPFVVSDNSSAGSRYGLNKAGSMGFNNADNYAQLQLLGTNGAYIDFTNSVGGDSNARLIYYAGNRLDLTYGFAPKSTISVTPNAIGIGTTNPFWALDVSGTAIRSFASGTIEPGFIVDYASSNGYGGLFIHTNGVRKWRIGNVGDTDSTSPALYIWQEGVGARMYFRNNGYVGVGTTIPNTKLSVSVPSDSALGSTSDGLSITDGTRNVQLLRNGTGYNYAGVVGSGSMLYSYDRMYIVADTSNPILFHAGGAERARVQANGNVGIGTSNPLQKLQVEGVVGNPALNGTTQSGIFRISNTTDNATLDFGIRAGGNGAWIQSTDETSLAAYYSLLLNPNGGFVGVGTTVPIASLDVENSVANIPVLNLAGGIAGNAVSDLYVLNSYNNNSGVGYAAKVIGVNISGSLTAQNIPLQRTIWGGVTSATAIALGTDGPRAGTQDNAFQIWTTNDGVAGTSLTQKFSVSSAGDVGIGIVTPTDKIQISGGGISFTSSTGLAVPMLGLTALNVAYVGPYNTPTDGNAPSTVLFNHGASVQQTWFYSSGSVAMVLNRQGRLHIGNNNNTPNCLLSVGPSSSTTAVSGMCFGNDAQANLYRSAEDTIKTDGNLVVAGTTSLNGHIYGQKTVALSTASWTTVLTVNMLAHNSCYVKIGAFGDWSNHSAVAFVSELFIQNGDNAGYGEPGTIITAHDNTRGPAGDKIDIQIVDPAAAGTQNFLIQLKLISATSSTNSSLITYHVMGQQASVT